MSSLTDKIHTVRNLLVIVGMMLLKFFNNEEI